MIQRIQTLYLIGAITMLVLASFTGELFNYVTDEAVFSFTGFGIEKSLAKDTVVETTSLPILVAFLAVAALAVVVMLSYKKINKQFALAKLLWGMYLLVLIGVVVWNYALAPSQIIGKVLSNNYGAAFYFLVIGLPFTHLAFMGIGKDKKTLDSLNRLR